MLSVKPHTCVERARAPKLDTHHVTSGFSRHCYRNSRCNRYKVTAFVDRDRKKSYTSPSSKNSTLEDNSLSRAEISRSRAQAHIRTLQHRWDAVENKTAVVVYGVSAVLGLYITSTVVDSIDRLPVLPGLFKLVGVTYSGWFAWRYVLFKDGRRDLSDLLQDIKRGLNEESEVVESTGQDLSHAARDVFKAADHKLTDTIQHMIHDRKPIGPDTSRGIHQTGGQGASAAASGHSERSGGPGAPRLPTDRLPGKARNEGQERNMMEEDI